MLRPPLLAAASCQSCMPHRSWMEGLHNLLHLNTSTVASPWRASGPAHSGQCNYEVFSLPPNLHPAHQPTSSTSAHLNWQEKSS
jgi:hypothetical protein